MKIMMPLNIIDVLAAATPIVASVASALTSKNNKTESNSNVVTPVTVTREYSKPQPKEVNITINNHFHVHSQREAVAVATEITDQMFNSTGKLLSDTRYII